MDPRQMVALRKALEGGEGAESPAEMDVAPDLSVADDATMEAPPVECPQCGCQFVPEPIEMASDPTEPTISG